MTAETTRIQLVGQEVDGAVGNRIGCRNHEIEVAVQVNVKTINKVRIVVRDAVTQLVGEIPIAVTEENCGVFPGAVDLSDVKLAVAVEVADTVTKNLPLDSAHYSLCELA